MLRTEQYFKTHQIGDNGSLPSGVVSLDELREFLGSGL
jgi:hypothetical protein